MVRHAIPLVVAPALPCIDRLEILLARARLRHTPTGLDPAEESLLTVLLSFDPSDFDRRAARALAATFIAADCSFAHAPAATDLGTWVTETLQKLPTSSTCVVVALPDYSPEVVRQIGRVMDAIRQGDHELQLVVGVATAPAHWSGLDVDGFVVVERGQRGTDALHMFKALAAIMAPTLIPCLDADDFHCALGTAERPSRLVNAVYLAGSDRSLPMSRDDRQVLSSTSGVAMMPSRSLPLAAQAHLAGLVRALVRPGAALTVIAPLGLTVEPRRSGDCAEVMLLCR